VLVAGGLGERLGYSGIKVALPVDSVSGQCFLGYYIEWLLALQGGGPPLPLAIMTSGDTHARTEELLRDHRNFGAADGQVRPGAAGRAAGRAPAGPRRAGRRGPPPAPPGARPRRRRTPLALPETVPEEPSRKRPPPPPPPGGAPQVTLIRQEKVACLVDGDARLSASGYAVETKPHGHGDVHSLLHTSGLAARWLREGRRWVCFFQDTNPAAFTGILPALGVSRDRGFDMCSIAVPRKAKEAIGAIARLVPSGGAGRAVTVNVEYNQLDPMLRASAQYPDGDGEWAGAGRGGGGGPSRSGGAGGEGAVAREGPGARSARARRGTPPRDPPPLRRPPSQPP